MKHFHSIALMILSISNKNDKDSHSLDKSICNEVLFSKNNFIFKLKIIKDALETQSLAFLFDKDNNVSKKLKKLKSMGATSASKN